MNNKQLVAWIAQWTDENLEAHLTRFAESIQQQTEGAEQDAEKLAVMQAQYRKRQTDQAQAE
jgi:hypothetical protein